MQKKKILMATKCISLSVVQAFWPVLITKNFIGCFETTVHAGKGPLGTSASYSRYSICKIDSYYVFLCPPTVSRPLS